MLTASINVHIFDAFIENIYILLCIYVSNVSVELYTCKEMSAYAVYRKAQINILNPYKVDHAHV